MRTRHVCVLYLPILPLLLTHPFPPSPPPAHKHTVPIQQGQRVIEGVIHSIIIGKLMEKYLHFGKKNAFRTYLLFMHPFCLSFVLFTSHFPLIFFVFDFSILFANLFSFPRKWHCLIVFYVVGGWGVFFNIHKSSRQLCVWKLPFSHNFQYMGPA